MKNQIKNLSLVSSYERVLGLRDNVESAHKETFLLKLPDEIATHKAI